MDMERADTLIAAGLPRQPANLWRKALDAIRACNRLGHVVRRSTSYTVITIHHHDGHSDADADSYPAAAADVDPGSLKRLLKEMDEECFRRLGGGAGVADRLASHPERGIAGDADDVRRRKADFGVNACPKPELKSFFGHVRDALSNVFLIALLVCSAVSLGVGIKEHGLKDGWYDGASLFLAVCLVSSLTAVCSHRQARRADKLASESADTVVTVVRAARRQEVSTFDVVVGDVVILRSGDAVPADGVLLHGHGLRVDEPHPGPVEIQAERNPFLASGMKVLDGHGSMLVTAVGTDTSLGEALRSHTDPHTATLQERLEGHTSTIGKVADAVAAVAFTVLTARHFTGCGTGMMPLLDKGVALAATLMLTLSMKPVVMDNALVHRLSALETMASVTAICADKTGTLTLNQMSVAEFWVGTEQPSSATAIAGGVVDLLCQGAGLNTTGSVYRPDDASPPEISGNPTEKALLSWAVACLGMDAATLRRSFNVLEVEEFDSHRKHGRAIISDKANGMVLAHWKGAADVVLARCSMYVDTRGDARELGIEQRNTLEKVSNDMGARGLRCIAFACKQVDDTELPKIDEVGLTLLGLVGLHDPCRPEVKAATEACTKAGVAVKMVTVDNISMACAAANGCGIMSSNDPDGAVVEGPKFVDMPPAHQLEMVDKIRVMARSRSGDKQVLVERLKQKGHVVAVTTGEGTSDARALGAADVVLYMHAPGARVAGSGRDIIILKGRFDAVVAAIRMGRCVYNNFKKMIQFYLTVNVVAIVVNFVPAVTTGDTPLTTEQLLWVNIVIGAMSALAVATDKPSDALMDSPPIARTAPLVSNAMWRDITAQAAFQIAVLLALEYRGRDVLGTDAKANSTMVFNVYVLCQVFNKFNTREMKKKNVFAGVLASTMFLVFIAGMLVLQVLMVEVLARFAGAERLGLGQWGICVAMAAVSWPVAMAAKFIPVPIAALTSPCRSSSRANVLC